MDHPSQPAAPTQPWMDSSGGLAAKWRMTTYVAWRNLWRSPFRSMLTVAAFGFSLTTMIAYGTLLNGEIHMFKKYATSLNLGHYQIHRQGYIKNQDQYALLSSSLASQLEEKLPAGYAAAPRLYGYAMASHAESSMGAFIKAVDPVLEGRVTDIGKKVEAGRFDLVNPAPPRNAEEARAPKGVRVWPVAVGRQMARGMRIQPGDTLVLLTQAHDGSIANGLFRVNAILSLTDPLIDRSGVVMSIQSYRELMALEEGVYEVALTTPFLDDVERARPVVAPLMETFLAAHPVPPEGGPVVIRSWREINKILSDMIQMAGGLLAVISTLFFTIAGIGLLNTMLMSVYERRKEFAILQALGMGRRWMVLMVFLESIFLSFLATIMGTLAGLAWAQRLVDKGWNFSEYLPDGLDMAGVVFPPLIYGQLNGGSVIKVIAGMYLVAILATVVPVVRMVRLKPVEVFE